MRKIVAFITVALLSTAASAQSFTEHVQKTTQGQGSVTVKQSDDIDNLVNGNRPSTTATAPKKQDDKTQKTPAGKQETKAAKDENKPSAQQHKDEKGDKPSTQRDSAKAEGKEPAAEREKTAKEEKREESAKAPTRRVKDNTEPAAEGDNRTVDTRKKVMRKSYKTDGYRVQAFAGGSTRADRQKAEQACNTIKTHYPDVPIYVHFYSPHWVCRVGNFRNQADAQKMLKQIKALGYSQAFIVKGKISVQY